MSKKKKNPTSRHYDLCAGQFRTVALRQVLLQPFRNGSSRSSGNCSRIPNDKNKGMKISAIAPGLARASVSVPSAVAALPPAAAASNDVPLTVKILTGSLHLTVLRAFPFNWDIKVQNQLARNEVWYTLSDLTSIDGSDKCVWRLDLNYVRNRCDI